MLGLPFLSRRACAEQSSFAVGRVNPSRPTPTVSWRFSVPGFPICQCNQSRPSKEAFSKKPLGPTENWAPTQSSSSRLTASAKLAPVVLASGIECWCLGQPTAREGTQTRFLGWPFVTSFLVSWWEPISLFLGWPTESEATAFSFWSVSSGNSAEARKGCHNNWHPSKMERPLKMMLVLLQTNAKSGHHVQKQTPAKVWLPAACVACFWLVIKKPKRKREAPKRVRAGAHCYKHAGRVT